MHRFKKKDKPGLIAGIDIGGGLIGLVVVAFILLMFAIVAGRAYSTQETAINAITDANVKQSVKDVSINAFQAMEDISGQLTLFAILFVLLVVVAIAYTFQQGSQGYGGAYGGGGRVM